MTRERSTPLEQEHTPGPWAVFGKSVVGVDLGPVNSISVADCKSECWSAERIEANARLIAAAPDLLAALQGLLAITNSLAPEAQTARIAIAKTRNEPEWP